jgi:type III restriction enzyme
MPILWRSDGREYNADMIAVDTDGTHWVIEIKSDRDADSNEVQAKRTAAQRWANHVNDNSSVTAAWNYLLVTEMDIAQAKESWSALKRLGR